MKQAGRPTKADIQIMRTHPLFAGLDPAMVAELIETARVFLCDKNEDVFQSGDPAEHFYIIAEGAVRLFRLKATGEEATVNVFRAPQSFGEAAIFLERAFPVSAECITQTRLVRVDAARIVQRIRSDPDVALGMLASMSTHLKLLVEEIALLRTLTAVRRAAEFLIRTCPQEEGQASFDLPYPKTVIAKRLGVTPEALSRSFAELRRHGVTISRKRVDIEDMTRVKQLL